MKNDLKKQYTLDNFIDDILDDKKEAKINEIYVGIIKPNIVSFLESQNIIIENNYIKLTYRKVMHALRDNKNPLQKVTVEQLKKIKDVIEENNVYFDTTKENLIYVAKLPQNEIINGRDWIKIPVNIYKNKNNIATLSRISSLTITKDKRYKKIDKLKD